MVEAGIYQGTRVQCVVFHYKTNWLQTKTTRQPIGLSLIGVGTVSCSAKRTQGVVQMYRPVSHLSIGVASRRT